MTPEGLGRFVAGMREAGFVGGNVTIPHKQAVMAHLGRIDPAAHAIGAVNTVWLEDGTLVGGNTDAHGFLANLDEGAPGWDGAATAVLVGAGGAARALCHGLLQRGLAVRIANRSRGAAEALAAQFGPRVSAGDWADLPRWLPDAGLLVNATALGMTGAPPLALDIAALRPDAVVCDIVYVPRDTALLRDAAARGHRTVDGLGMLLHQAAPGFARWFGQMPVVTAELRALLAADIDRAAQGQGVPIAAAGKD